MAREIEEEPEAPARKQGLRLGSSQGTTTLILYFDTSALVKLVLLESGSDLARELWDGPYRVVSTVFAYPEGRAALATARRSRRLDDDLYRKSLANFEHTYAELVAVSVDERLARTAGALASEFSLRGYDAVHLATALSLEGSEVTLVSWDRELCGAAAGAGLAVAGALD